VKLSDVSVRRPVFAAVLAMLIAVSAWSASSACRCANIRTSIRRSSRSRPNISAPRRASSKPASPRCSKTSFPASRGSRPSPRAPGRPVQHHHRILPRPLDRKRRQRRARPRRRGGGQPPDDIRPPEVRKVDADASPILFLVVSKPGWSRLELSDYVDRNLARPLLQRSRASPASSSAAKRGRRCGSGCSPAARRLRPDPRRPRAARFARQNVELPAGRLESAQQNVTLRVDRPFANAGNSPARRRPRRDGYLVRLGDVARVEQGPENPYTPFA
jgi:multidrug efflux pump